MPKEHYKTSGNDKVGYRIAVPQRAKPVAVYRCEIKRNGTLIYTPVTL